MILPEERIVLAHLANTGTGIGFNNGEAVWLSELFLPDRESPDETSLRNWSGVYTFRTVESTLVQAADGRVRPAPGDTVPGRLSLHERGGRLRGSLTIGTRSAPVPTAVEVGGTLELFAVPGSWRKLWLTPTATGWRGRWEIAGLPSGRLRLEGEIFDIRRVAP